MPIPDQLGRAQTLDPEAGMDLGRIKRAWWLEEAAEGMSRGRGGGSFAAMESPEIAPSKGRWPTKRSVVERQIHELALDRVIWDVHGPRAFPLHNEGPGEGCGRTA